MKKLTVLFLTLAFNHLANIVLFFINILIVAHGGVSVPIKCYFMQYPLEKLINRDCMKGLKNCEVIKFEI